MHIVLVSADHHPDHGGIGAATALVARAAVEAGWRVDLVTRDGGAPPAGVRVHAVRTGDETPGFAERVEALRRIDRIRPWRYGGFALAAAGALLRLDGRPDAIAFADARGTGYAALRSARVRGRFPGVPMIVHAHTPMFIEETVNGADPRRFGRHVYHGWERRAIAAADAVVTTSRWLAHAIGRPDAEVIPYPLFPPSEPAAPRPPSTTAGTLLLVGTMQPRKGVDVWVRSLNRVLAHRPHARAEIIGPDTLTAPGGRSMAAHLLTLLAPALRSRLRVRGRVGHAETLAAIAAADVVVAPSRFDSFGLSAAEAALLGRPLVVSDRVGMAEHVAGLSVVPDEDEEALAAAQLAVLARPGEAARRAAVVREALIAACAPAGVIRRHEALLKRTRPGHDRSAVPVPEGTAARRGPDAMDRLARHLRAIEHREREASRRQIA